MPSGSLSFIAASLFVLAVILGFVWKSMRSLASRLADRIYFWRYPIARFVEDATALAIEVPSAEVLAASQNPAHGPELPSANAQPSSARPTASEPSVPENAEPSK